MNVKIVLSKELGSECWSSIKHMNNCVGCHRYLTCTYPSRKRNAVYDLMQKELSAKRREVDALSLLLSKYETGQLHPPN